MDSCLPSTVVFFLCIICIFLDIQYHGIVPFILITDIFISFILLSIISWFCSSVGVGLAWFTTIGFTLAVLYAIYNWRINHPNYVGIIESRYPLYFLNPYNYNYSPHMTLIPSQTLNLSNYNSGSPSFYNFFSPY